MAPRRAHPESKHLLYAPASRLLRALINNLSSVLGPNHYPTYHTYISDIFHAFNPTMCAQAHAHLTTLIGKTMDNRDPLAAPLHANAVSHGGGVQDLTSFLNAYEHDGKVLYGENDLVMAVRTAKLRLKKWLREEFPDAIFLHKDLVKVLVGMGEQVVEFSVRSVEMPVGEMDGTEVKLLRETYAEMNGRYFKGLLGLRRYTVLAEAGDILGPEWGLLEIGGGGGNVGEVTREDVDALWRSAEESIVELQPMVPPVQDRAVKSQRGGARRGARGRSGRGRGRGRGNVAQAARRLCPTPAFSAGNLSVSTST
ncbi:hypothetical protein CC80DRAFT_504188 [Byssothecium circinans]|uniref:Uncharacterized protein n=1 Tax=Byssothecium circinans TaxID=147558 RepID=A0A6A5TZQ8_9PLEO|nr:hypothetical protein CC80DRAFT_504188 [Byssothecium circinans]